MKIINRISEQIYDIKNIDFNKNVIFGSSQINQWSDELPELKIIETDESVKLEVEELITNSMLSLPQYQYYCKLSDYTGNWNDYPTCVQRIFCKTEDIIYFTMNYPDFIVQMRLVEPINPIIEYSNGSLIYFYTELQPDVVTLMNNRGIIIESRPLDTTTNNKITLENLLF